ncbi:hypothetical protein BaRGS_00015368 [Batillaria attramentaria]|uniref:Protein phosphatase 1 regulatory subunit 36 n=1 Tax=Batillaria attramentaria TaxID=370345 RepID=A0ABD0L2B7_9CAEN
MVQTETRKEKHPVSGRWIWKDDPMGLEFVSNSPQADKGKRSKKHGHDAKGQGRAASSRVAGGRKRQPKPPNNVKGPSKKDQVEHSYVTLDDIKSVALDMMGEVEMVPESFEELLRAEQFDYFLVHLLSYFSCFFDKINQDTKKNPMYIELSLSEKKAYANVLQRMEVAQKLLGQSYCILVLGLGLDKLHHMECGTSRVSSTYKDRGIFETFYTFCTFVVWITFRRKEFEVVKKEIGRMLRSDTFNPAIRVKYAPEDSKDEPKEKKGDDKKEVYSLDKLSPAEYRRLHPRRPPIKSIIEQRSPAIVSILPSPKEEAGWLFKRARALSPRSLSKYGHEDEEPEDVEERFRDLIIDVKKFRAGILGEPYNMFNPLTLTPLGAENEDEENAGEDGEKTNTEGQAAEKSQASDHGTSRQQTAISHTTTDVATDDES